MKNKVSFCILHFAFCILHLSLAMFAFSFSARPAHAVDEATRLYNEGNTLYRQGKYAEAAGVYERLLASGARNGRIYYNLGNAYFKMNRIGRAILAYERAQRLMPGDEDVASNLQFANLLKIDKETTGEVNAITRFGRWLLNLFSANLLSFACSLCLFGISGALIGKMFRPEPRLRPVWTGAVVSLGVLLLLGGTLLAFKIHAREFEQAAIVMAGEADGRSGPDENNIKVFTLHEGTRVFIQRAEGGWLLVRLPSGIGGWVRAKDVEKV
ncbi:MAG: tetratricopeptide repeat protein [Candidatus Latescibacteria bacterium]|nr:tetratricopeptide repeat protein [Candidatus Latescibacterota bacterium]